MTLTRLDAVCILDAAGRQRQVASALARNFPDLVPVPEHSRSVAVVASGPSVKGELEKLRAWDGDIWAINGALDWLMSEGICPDVYLGLDPEECMVDYLRNPPEKTDYYMAAVCHPSAFDCLKDRKVFLWYAADEASPPPSGKYAVGGGTTCLTKAPYLAYMLGYRDIHLFGCDSSFHDASHVYGGDIPDDAVSLKVEGRTFLTNMAWIHQAAFLACIKDTFPAKFILHGDGLAQTFVNAKPEEAYA
jgi:hypothetical protein